MANVLIGDGRGKLLAHKPGVLLLQGGVSSGPIPGVQFTLVLPTQITQGATIALTGSLSGGFPIALESSVDNGSSWQAVTSYRPVAGSWTGLGPVADTLGNVFVIVRDKQQPTILASATTNVVAPPPGLTTLQITDPVAHTVYQMAPGQLSANIPVRFAYTGTPNRMQGRLLSGSTVIIDWSDLDNLTVGSGAGFGLLSSCPPGNGYTLAVRDQANGISSTSSVNNLSVGDRWVIMGGTSENAILALSAQPDGGNALLQFNANPKTLKIYDNAGFHDPGTVTLPPPAVGGVNQSQTNTAIPGILTLERVYSKLITSNKPELCLIPFTRAGSTIAQWQFSGSCDIGMLSASGNGTIAAAGLHSSAWEQSSQMSNASFSDIAGVVVFLGEAEFASATAGSFKTSLDTIYARFLAMVQTFSRGSDQLGFVVVIPQGVSPANGGANSERVRLDIMNFVASNQTIGRKVSMISALDLSTSDGLNFGVDGQVTLLARQILAMQYHAGLTGTSAQGPYISGGVLSGTSVTLTITHDGGSALTTNSGGSPSGFYVSTDNFATGSGPGTGAYVTPSAVAIVDANTIRITLPSALSSVQVKYQGGTPGNQSTYNGTNNASNFPDISNAVRDNIGLPTDPTLTAFRPPIPGLPLRPMLAPLSLTQ